MNFLSIIFYFFRELVFDSSEEYNLKSVNFNTKKALIFIMLVVSITTNIILFTRVVVLALEQTDNSNTICALSKVAVITSPSHKLSEEPPLTVSDIHESCI